MTKRKRNEDWSFQMTTGLVTHGPTGLVFRMYVPWHQVLDNPLRPPAVGSVHRIDNEPWIYLGQATMPPDVIDRRPAGLPPPGDANERGIMAWPVMTPENASRPVLEALVAQHGPDQAAAMMGRIAREAGERWVFRARLERGWPDGRRAV